jgi:hypothetical protein
MQQWIQLITTVLLLVVTAGYAVTTMDMAKTARDAARESGRASEAAERAAAAAKEAAEVAKAQVRVEFIGRRIAVGVGDDHVPSVEIMSSGDTVFVLAVRCARAFRDGADGGWSDQPELEGVTLQPVGSALPRRLHRGERIHFTHPDMLTGDSPFGRFILYVEYGFSEDVSGGSKQLIVSSDWYSEAPMSARAKIQEVPED